MGRARINPFQGFVDTVSEMNRMRELGKTGHEIGHEDRQRTHATAWVPSANIFARGRDLMIRVSLAGVAPENIDITFSDGLLTIAGERMNESDEEEVGFYVRELYYGIFRRNFTLPSGIDESNISADFENGMVEITVRGGVVAGEPRRIALRDKSDKRPRQ